MNKAATNIYLQVFLFLLGKYLGVRSLGRYGNLLGVELFMDAIRNG